LRNQGHRVQLIDASALRMDPAAVLAAVADSDLVVIATASLDRWQCPNLDLTPVLKLTSLLAASGKPFFISGTHGTVRPRQLLGLTGARGVIRGEPELTIADLAGGTPLEKCAGLTWHRLGEVAHNPDRPLADLTQFPVPAFDLLDFKHYFYEVLGERFNLFEASRGCPYGCTFCVKSMYGQGYRKKTLHQLIAEVDYCVDQLGVKSAYFIDLEFTLNRKLVLGLCNHLQTRGNPLRWCCQTRLDSVDRELLAAMKSAGCEIIHFGVETGSPPIAAGLHKGISLSRIREGMKLTRAAGMQTVCFFMFGLPDERLTDMKATLRLARKLNPTYASFHIALPYPGTAFHEQVQESLDGALFPTAYTGRHSEATLNRVVRRAFLSYYLRPRYLWARLRGGEFRSLARQAAFFLKYFKARLLG